MPSQITKHINALFGFRFDNADLLTPLLGRELPPTVDKEYLRPAPSCIFYNRAMALSRITRDEGCSYERLPDDEESLVK